MLKYLNVTLDADYDFFLNLPKPLNTPWNQVHFITEQRCNIYSIIKITKCSGKWKQAKIGH